MHDFLTGVHTWRDGGRDQALSTLDLSFLPEHLRAVEGPVLADYLNQIIDRAGYVIWQEIPDDPEHPAPYVHYEHSRGAVTIERVADADAGGNRWRFSSRTLRVPSCMRFPRAFRRSRESGRIRRSRGCSRSASRSAARCPASCDGVCCWRTGSGWRCSRRSG